MQDAEFTVKISLEDFFNSDRQKEFVFQDALKSAIVSKLSDNEWVQKNIAYYLFEFLKDGIYKKEIDRINESIFEKITSYKSPDKWDVSNHPRYKKAMNDALDAMAPEIEEATTIKANEILADEGRSYDSFYGKVADQMVSRVMDHFVDAMVEKAKK